MSLSHCSQGRPINNGLLKDANAKVCFMDFSYICAKSALYFFFP